jgi:hypothetical protein
LVQNFKSQILRGTWFFGSKINGASQFWKGLHQVKHLFKWGAVFQVGNGKLCRFWEDSWAHEVPLKILFSDLYKLTRDPFCYVNDCYEDGNWFVDFKRCLSSQDYDRWLGLLHMLNDCSLTDNKADSVQWALEKKKMFTTKSLYRFLTDRGVSCRVAGIIWKCRVPLKIKFFLWQISNNKLQVAVNLAKKKWKGSILCFLCCGSQNIDHVFFKCHLAKFVWEVICEVFNLASYPSSWDLFCSTWLRGKGPLPNRLTMFMFSWFAWALWTARNKTAIEKKVPKAPIDVIYNALSFIQRWSVLLREKDQVRILQAKESIASWLKSFRPSDICPSDVIEFNFVSCLEVFCLAV